MAITGYQLIVIEWTLVVLTFIFVNIRTYYRRTHSSSLSLNLSDYFVIFAWLSFASQASMDSVLFRNDFFSPGVHPWSLGVPPDRGILGLKIYYVERITLYNTVYAVKAAIIGLYIDFIPRDMRKSRLVMIITAIIIGLGWSSEVLLNAFVCLPVRRQWSLSESESCPASSLTIPWIVQGVPHLLTDVLVYVIPIPTIIKLELSSHITIGLVVTFGVGLLCLVFASATFAAAYFSTQVTTAWLFGAMEQTYAILVACCPAIKACCVRSRSQDTRLRWKGQELTDANTVDEEQR